VKGIKGGKESQGEKKLEFRGIFSGRTKRVVCAPALSSHTSRGKGRFEEKGGGGDRMRDQERAPLSEFSCKANQKTSHKTLSLRVHETGKGKKT